jgi:anti-anti-sigma factor
MEAKVANEVLTVEGFAELTAANHYLFRNQLCTHLNGHTTIEIDLSRTTVIDCTGLGALIASRNLARARNGAVRLVNPTPTVQRLLELVRAGHLFEIVHNPRAGCSQGNSSSR